MRPFRLPPQILRLVLLTLAIVGSYLVARAVLTPASFREFGWYRGAALQEIAARQPVFAGKPACAACHAAEMRQLSAGPHTTLSCETCHGPNLAHAQNPKILPAKLSRDFCVRCHEANPSRPAWFKQIVLKDHYGDNCTSCHQPHSPNQTP